MEDIESLAETGKPIERKVYSKPARIFFSVVEFPICCSLCIVWSTTWRCLACPYQCLCYGPSAMCSDNGCTQCSDICLSESCKGINKEVPKPAIDGKDVNVPSEEDKSMVKEAFIHLQQVLEQTNNTNVYHIIDYAHSDVCKVYRGLNLGENVVDNKASIIAAIHVIVEKLKKE